MENEFFTLSMFPKIYRSKVHLNSDHWQNMLFNTVHPLITHRKH